MCFILLCAGSCNKREVVREGKWELVQEKTGFSEGGRVGGREGGEKVIYIPSRNGKKKQVHCLCIPISLPISPKKNKSCTEMHRNAQVKGSHPCSLP